MAESQLQIKTTFGSKPKMNSKLVRYIYNHEPQPKLIAIEMDRIELSRIHLAIRHRIMLKAFGEIGLDKDISEERIQAADFIIDRKQGPKTAQFPRGYRLTVAKGIVKFHNGEISVK